MANQSSDQALEFLKFILQNQPNLLSNDSGYNYAQDLRDLYEGLVDLLDNEDRRTASRGGRDEGREHSNGHDETSERGHNSGRNGYRAEGRDGRDAERRDDSESY